MFHPSLACSLSPPSYTPTVPDAETERKEKKKRKKKQRLLLTDERNAA